MKAHYRFVLAVMASLLLGCNQTTPGQNTTDAGTQQSDKSVNAEMENNRTASDVDTVLSPGSNAKDIKGKELATGTSEPNKQAKSTGSGNGNESKGQSK